MFCDLKCRAWKEDGDRGLQSWRRLAALKEPRCSLAFLKPHLVQSMGFSCVKKKRKAPLCFFKLIWSKHYTHLDNFFPETNRKTTGNWCNCSDGKMLFQHLGIWSNPVRTWNHWTRSALHSLGAARSSLCVPQKNLQSLGFARAFWDVWNPLESCLFPMMQLICNPGPRVDPNTDIYGCWNPSDGPSFQLGSPSASPASGPSSKMPAASVVRHWPTPSNSQIANQGTVKLAGEDCLTHAHWNEKTCISDPCQMYPKVAAQKSRDLGRWEVEQGPHTENVLWQMFCHDLSKNALAHQTASWCDNAAADWASPASPPLFYACSFTMGNTGAAKKSPTIYNGKNVPSRGSPQEHEHMFGNKICYECPNDMKSSTKKIIAENWSELEIVASDVLGSTSSVLA